MNIKTITSTEGVNEVDFGSGASRFYWFQNLGTTTVHVSGNADIVAGSDGVAELAAGDSVCIETLGGKVYVLGAGKVQIHNTGDKFCPFKNAPAAGGGGGNSYTKSESDAKYAQKTDIPSSLPANGGNADTVDGMHADDFATSVNPTIIGGIKVVRPSSTSTSQSIFSILDTIRIRNLDSETSQANNYADIVVTTSGVFTEKAINGVFQGRKELLTSTCVTGTSTIIDSNNFVSVNFGFTPSAVLYAVYDSKTDVDNNYRLAQEFNSTGFVAHTRVAPVVGGTETFSYIAFR